MNRKTTYKLYICYGKDKWHDLRRDADDPDKAFRTQEHIAKEHGKTTKIAIVEVCYTTISLTYGTNTILKPKRTTHCKACHKRRFRKNINPKTGICLACEMRKSVNEDTPINELNFKG
jgi:hypothetical protein